jgi:hypothetical protein
VSSAASCPKAATANTCFASRKRQLRLVDLGGV